MFSASPASPGTTPRSPRARRLLALVVALVALVAVVLLVGLGVLDGDEDVEVSAPRAAPSPTPVPRVALRDLDTSELTVQRAEFCDLVSSEVVEAALGGPPQTSSSYGNGQAATLAPGVEDIAHEYGCRWQRDGTTLAAWVFAPPVSPDDARRLVGEARGAQGCDVRPQAPDYGSPSVARTCLDDARGQARIEASYRGLFGDAWLACSRTSPAGAGSDDAATARAALDEIDDWCVAVAAAASAPGD